MADMFKMVREAASMRKQMKKVQKELEGIMVSGSSGDVKITLRGDMTVRSVQIAPSAVDPTRVDKLEKMVTAAMNNALADCQKTVGQHMQKVTGGLGGLSSLLGGG